MARELKMSEIFPRYFGTVKFVARCNEDDITWQFPKVEFVTDIEGFSKVELDNLTGDSVVGIVHVEPRSSQTEIQRSAMESVIYAINELAFALPTAIHDPEWQENDLYIQSRPGVEPSPIINPASGSGTFGDVRVRMKSTAEAIKSQMKPIPSTKSAYLEHFRLAFSAQTGVEKYMGFYQLLLNLTCNANGDESPVNLDRFILACKPSVATSSSPHTKKQETVYTRLRSEFAHVRQGVDLRSTKSEMNQRWGELMECVKIAMLSP